MSWYDNEKILFLKIVKEIEILKVSFKHFIQIKDFFQF